MVSQRMSTIVWCVRRGGELLQLLVVVGQRKPNPNDGEPPAIGAISRRTVPPRRVFPPPALLSVSRACPTWRAWCWCVAPSLALRIRLTARVSNGKTTRARDQQRTTHHTRQAGTRATLRSSRHCPPYGDPFDFATSPVNHCSSPRRRRLQEISLECLPPCRRVALPLAPASGSS